MGSDEDSNPNTEGAMVKPAKKETKKNKLKDLAHMKMTPPAPKKPSLLESMSSPYKKLRQSPATIMNLGLEQVSAKIKQRATHQILASSNGPTASHD